MTDDYALSGCLDSLAQSFERQEQELSASPDKVAGWGQFLHVSRVHSQTGLYGTASGLLVRAIAGRLAGAEPDANARLLVRWYRDRQNTGSQSSRYFAQTLRLAHLHLCVRIANIAPIAETQAEIYDDLMSRQLNDGLWGDWWLSPRSHDSTPRLFTSALVLLSFGLLDSPPSAHPDGRLTKAAERLERGILGHGDPPSAHIAVTAAALTCTAGHKVGRDFSRLAVSVARNSPWRIVDQTIYFYEFREPHGDAARFSRDYFIIPPAHLLAIAGCQPTSPGPLRAATSQIVGALAKNVRANSGTFRTEPGDLVSTTNQAWTALVFSAAMSTTGDSVTVLDRLGHCLFRRRTSRWNPVEILRVLGLIWSTVTLATLTEGRLWCKAVVAVCMFLLSEFYRIKSRIRVRRW